MRESISSRPTKIVPQDSPGALDEAMMWFCKGDVVAFPTDTVYGLGAVMNNIAAVERLYRIKERPPEMGTPLLLAEAEDIEWVCREIPVLTWKLVESFWPGGLSLVLLRKPIVPPLVTGGRWSVAVRLAAHDLPRELARRLQVPLAVSSANRSGYPAPATAADVEQQLRGRIPLILDGGACPQAQASTIVDLTVDPPKILRSGPISREDIEGVLGFSLSEG